MDPHKLLRRINLPVVILTVSVIGVMMLYISHAATEAVSMEAESGQLANMTAAVDSGASGGNAVRFGPVGANVKTLGAKGDGVTDDAPALRAALAANDTVHIPPGTYLLKTFMSPRPARLNADFMFDLRSNQTINAEPGAIFKIADGVIIGAPSLWGGNVFMADTKTNIHINGLTVDINGDKNLVPSTSKTITGYGLYMWQATNVTVDDVTWLDTPGQNYIVGQSGTNGVRILNSTFINGGTSLPGNTNQIDFSAMYFVGGDITIDNAKITHTNYPFTYSGGIELHGYNQSVTDSVIEKSWPAIYIAPDLFTNLPLGHDITVKNNKFTDCLRGVTFSSGGDAPIDKIKITNNVMKLHAFPAVGSEPTRAIDQDMPQGSTWDYHHIITNLDISGNSFIDQDGKTDAGIQLSQIHSASLKTNTFNGIVGAALKVLGSPWETKNINFESNTVNWLGTTGAPAIILDTGGSSLSPPVSAFTSSNITMLTNNISLPAFGSSKCAFYVDWSGSTASPFEIRGNTLANIGLSTCGPKASQVTFQP